MSKTSHIHLCAHISVLIYACMYVRTYDSTGRAGSAGFVRDGRRYFNGGELFSEDTCRIVIHVLVTKPEGTYRHHWEGFVIEVELDFARRSFNDLDVITVRIFLAYRYWLIFFSLR